MMIPIAYTYDWLTNVFQTGAISISSIPSALNFYPSFGIQYIPGWLFNSIVKFPFLISDILVTLLLYKIVNDLTSNKCLAEKAALLWFLNPFVIWISAVWGMWDTLPALFSLAAFYLLIKKKYALSAICISLGVASKLYPLLFVVPMLIYIQKSSMSPQKLRNILTFISAFLVVSILLFAPSFGVISNFVSNYFIPVSQASDLVTNQLDYPLGFGLTYWTLSLLTRIFNFIIAGSTISFFIFLSLVLFGICLIFSYWKIRRMNIKKTTDLVLVVLLPLLYLFLTYRIICEQFFVWLIPFIILLVIYGRIKPILYFSISLTALFYVLLNCPFPFFFLPLTPWCTPALLSMATFMLSCETLRLSILVLLGCVFSILLVIIMRQATRKTAY